MTTFNDIKREYKLSDVSHRMFPKWVLRRRFLFWRWRPLEDIGWAKKRETFTKHLLDLVGHVLGTPVTADIDSTLENVCKKADTNDNSSDYPLATEDRVIGSLEYSENALYVGGKMGIKILGSAPGDEAKYNQLQVILSGVSRT